MSKALSCGIVILKGSEVLLCHATGQTHWDIPKGHMEEGETTLETAIRECGEETGFVVEPHLLMDLGRFKYNARKDLYLFGYSGDKFPVPEHCECSSYFIHPRTKQCLPEVDNYCFVNVAKLRDFVTRNMYNTLDEAFYKMGVKI